MIKKTKWPNQAMSVQLRPSFVRACAAILVMLFAAIGIAYFWEGYREHHWWGRDYIPILLISFTVVPALVCLVWVPSEFAFTDTHLTIRFPFRRLRTVAWDDLEYYGGFEGVYGLQFHTAGTFTFYPHALPRREWRMLKSFLSTTFPERKASGYVGARLFKWPRRKT